MTPVIAIATVLFGSMFWLYASSNAPMPTTRRRIEQAVIAYVLGYLAATLMVAVSP